MSKVAVLGSGVVGQTLADGFLKFGWEVMRGTRDAGKLSDWKSKAGERASVGTFGEAAKWGDVVVLAVKGTAAAEVIAACGDGIDGKPVLDATNPIADAPPENGVIKYFTGPNESLIEALQKKAPKAHFVKAFSCVGNAWMVSPDFGGQKPTMFICGDDEGAKKKTGEILAQFGWEVEDMGASTAARAIEPLAMLWCIPGIAKGRWTHAFKLLKK